MTEPTVQVPVSLIEEAPHTPGCQIDGLWILPERGGLAQQQSGECACWKARFTALLSQPTQPAEPRDHDFMSVVDGTTWVERNDGWQHVDVLDREVRLRRSRFHGLMVGVDGHWAYIGDDEGRMRDYLTADDATSSAGGADAG